MAFIPVSDVTRTYLRGGSVGVGDAVVQRYREAARFVTQYVRHKYTANTQALLIIISGTDGHSAAVAKERAHTALVRR